MSEGPFNVIFVGGSVDRELRAVPKLSPIYHVPVAPKWVKSGDWIFAEALEAQVVGFKHEEYRLEPIATKTQKFYLYVIDEMTIEDALNRVLMGFVTGYGRREVQEKGYQIPEYKRPPASDSAA